MQSKVIAKVGKSGLCNRLLIWAKAYTFSHINQLPLYTHGWYSIRFGPFLRREKSKRFYGFYFRQKTCYSQLIMDKIKNNKIIHEPKIDVCSNNGIYIFDKVPSQYEYFDKIINYRNLITESFYGMINKKYIDIVNTYNKPIIGVHIRRGDFSYRGYTNEEFFAEIINKLREYYQEKLEVSVFTDGIKEDFKIIPKLENINFIDTGIDLVDLLVLASSKIIVPTPGSTFSYWASFISDAAIIKHENSFNIRKRNTKDSNNNFEGTINDFLQTKPIK